MSIFSDAIDDIFNVPEFKQTMIAGNQTITVISYQSDVNTAYTEFGVDNGQSIQVTCKCADYTPVRGNKVTFRSKQFKIADFLIDSHNLTYIITLKDVSSK